MTDAHYKIKGFNAKLTKEQQRGLPPLGMQWEENEFKWTTSTGKEMVETIVTLVPIPEQSFSQMITHGWQNFLRKFNCIGPQSTTPLLPTDPRKNQVKNSSQQL